MCWKCNLCGNVKLQPLMCPLAATQQFCGIKCSSVSAICMPGWSGDSPVSCGMFSKWTNEKNTCSGFPLWSPDVYCQECKRSLGRAGSAGHYNPYKFVKKWSTTNHLFFVSTGNNTVAVQVEPLLCNIPLQVWLHRITKGAGKEKAIKTKFTLRKKKQR